MTGGERGYRYDASFMADLRATVDRVRAEKTANLTWLEAIVPQVQRIAAVVSGAEETPCRSVRVLPAAMVDGLASVCGLDVSGLIIRCVVGDVGHPGCHAGEIPGVGVHMWE